MTAGAYVHLMQVKHSSWMQCLTGAYSARMAPSLGFSETSEKQYKVQAMQHTFPLILNNGHHNVDVQQNVYCMARSVYYFCRFFSRKEREITPCALL